jgi:hypothetical protein
MIGMGWDEVAATVDSHIPRGDYYLIYYGFNRPSFREYHFDDTYTYEVEVIDTWEMTIQNIGRFCGKIHIDLPGKEYMAVRIRRV